ncbi:MAG: GNAT family N-acetyltransferase [Candidatus Latescibacterota bacterium]
MTLQAPGTVYRELYRELAAGFIKAEEPQLDVSYTVHDRTTLAINGMYVHPDFRRREVGASLLAALARQACAMDKALVSVDYETTNIEAFGFWTRWFEPVSWSHERRV